MDVSIYYIWQSLAYKVKTSALRDQVSTRKPLEATTLSNNQDVKPTLKLSGFNHSDKSGL